MLFRLNIYRLILKVCVYLLTFVTFESGLGIWSPCMVFLSRPNAYTRDGHFTLVLFSSFVWAFMAQHYNVTKFDELFRERTGAKAALTASVATTVILMGILYFGHNVAFPRGLLICCLISLFVLTVLFHAVFRFLYRNKLLLGRPSRFLIVVADPLACERAIRRRRLSFAPCPYVA